MKIRNNAKIHTEAVSLENSHEEERVQRGNVTVQTKGEITQIITQHMFVCDTRAKSMFLATQVMVLSALVVTRPLSGS